MTSEASPPHCITRGLEQLVRGDPTLDRLHAVRTMHGLLEHGSLLVHVPEPRRILGAVRRVEDAQIAELLAPPEDGEEPLVMVSEAEGLLVQTQRSTRR